ncbi:MAG: FecR domain-containing protein, partial [Terriglobales bacterium]
GRLRNRVVKLTKPGAKYEVKTPHAVIGVIGTDFYVFVDELRTVVIVYSGKVVVKQRRKDDRDPKMLVLVEPGRQLGAGQMLEVRAPGTTTPLPLAEPESTPPGVQEDSMEQTSIEDRKERPPWSPKKKILVIGGITAAILTPVLIVITSDDQGCINCSSGP